MSGYGAEIVTSRPSAAGQLEVASIGVHRIVYACNDMPVDELSERDRDEQFSQRI